MSCGIQEAKQSERGREYLIVRMGCGCVREQLLQQQHIARQALNWKVLGRVRVGMAVSIVLRTGRNEEGLYVALLRNRIGAAGVQELAEFRVACREGVDELHGSVVVLPILAIHLQEWYLRKVSSSTSNYWSDDMETYKAKEYIADLLGVRPISEALVELREQLLRKVVDDVEELENDLHLVRPDDRRGEQRQLVELARSFAVIHSKIQSTPPSEPQRDCLCRPSLCSLSR